MIPEWSKTMRRSATEVIRSLEMRIARLERQSGPLDSYYLDQHSRHEQERDERYWEKRRKIDGPGHEEMLAGLVHHRDVDMLSSGGKGSIKIPIPTFAMKDADNLIGFLNLKIEDHTFDFSRGKITITNKFERKFTLAFDYKFDRKSVVIYHGKSFH